MITAEEKERKRSRRSRSRDRKRSRSRDRKRSRRSRSRDRKRDRDGKRGGGEEGGEQDFGEDGVPIVKEEDVDTYTGYGGYNPEDQNGGEEEETGQENEEYEGWSGGSAEQDHVLFLIDFELLFLTSLVYCVAVNFMFTIMLQMDFTCWHVKTVLN